ncbi:unnamed protein product [Amoebophrya sp. A120]|nr:unnamed protein product [Amoebophrya sp. A120]|eukprot:GSA120T00021404001.1
MERTKKLPGSDHDDPGDRPGQFHAGDETMTAGRAELRTVIKPDKPGTLTEEDKLFGLAALALHSNEDEEPFVAEPADDLAEAADPPAGADALQRRKEKSRAASAAKPGGAAPETTEEETDSSRGRDAVAQRRANRAAKAMATPDEVGTESAPEDDASGGSSSSSPEAGKPKRKPKAKAKKADAPLSPVEESTAADLMGRLAISQKYARKLAKALNNDDTAPGRAKMPVPATAKDKQQMEAAGLNIVGAPAAALESVRALIKDDTRTFTEMRRGSQDVTSPAIPKIAAPGTMSLDAARQLEAGELTRNDTTLSDDASSCQSSAKYGGLKKAPKAKAKGKKKAAAKTEDTQEEETGEEESEEDFKGAVTSKGLREKKKLTPKKTKSFKKTGTPAKGKLEVPPEPDGGHSTLPQGKVLGGEKNLPAQTRSTEEDGDSDAKKSASSSSSDGEEVAVDMGLFHTEGVAAVDETAAQREQRQSQKAERKRQYKEKQQAREQELRDEGLPTRDDYARLLRKRNLDKDLAKKIAKKLVDPGADPEEELAESDRQQLRQIGLTEEAMDNFGNLRLELGRAIEAENERKEQKKMEMKKAKESKQKADPSDVVELDEKEARLAVKKLKKADSALKKEQAKQVSPLDKTDAERTLRKAGVEKEYAARLAAFLADEGLDAGLTLPDDPPSGVDVQKLQELGLGPGETVGKMRGAVREHKKRLKELKKENTVETAIRASAAEAAVGVEVAVKKNRKSAFRNRAPSNLRAMPVVALPDRGEMQEVLLRAGLTQKGAKTLARRLADLSTETLYTLPVDTSQDLEVLASLGFGSGESASRLRGWVKAAADAKHGKATKLLDLQTKETTFQFDRSDAEKALVRAGISAISATRLATKIVETRDRVTADSIFQDVDEPTLNLLKTLGFGGTETGVQWSAWVRHAVKKDFENNHLLPTLTIEETIAEKALISAGMAKQYARKLAKQAADANLSAETPLSDAKTERDMQVLRQLGL